MHVVVVDPFRSLLDQYPFKNQWTSRMAQMAFFPIIQPGWIFYPSLTYPFGCNFWIVTKRWTSFSITHNNFQSVQMNETFDTNYAVAHILLRKHWKSLDGVKRNHDLQMNSAGLHRKQSKLIIMHGTRPTAAGFHHFSKIYRNRA